MKPWTCPDCGFGTDMPGEYAARCDPLGGPRVPPPGHAPLHWPSGMPTTVREARLVQENNRRVSARLRESQP